MPVSHDALREFVSPVNGRRRQRHRSSSLGMSRRLCQSGQKDQAHSCSIGEMCCLHTPNENKMSHAAVDGVGCKLRVELGKRS